MSNLTVVNVVGGGNIRRGLDLRTVYEDFPGNNLQYDPEVFSALVISYESPKATIMLYSSGKYSLAGAKNKTNAIEASQKFESDIKSMLCKSLSDTSFEIRYLVCTGNLGRPINLNKTTILFGSENTEYEPEQFPGLFYRPEDEDWFSIIFASGKIVLDGTADVEELERAFQRIKTKLDSD